MSVGWGMLGVFSKYVGDILGYVWVMLDVYWSILVVCLGILTQHCWGMFGVCWSYIRSILGVCWGYFVGVLRLCWEH